MLGLTGGPSSEMQTNEVYPEEVLARVREVSPERAQCIIDTCDHCRKNRKLSMVFGQMVHDWTGHIFTCGAQVTYVRHFNES